MISFWDTSALINNVNQLYNTSEIIYFSSITLKELENIKSSNEKNETIKYQARQLSRFLCNNSDKYKIFYWEDNIKFESPILLNNNDSKIIQSALQLLKEDEVTFFTSDISCKLIAEACGLKAILLQEKEDDYTGFISFKFNTDEELATFYESVYTPSFLKEVSYINQYLFVKDKDNKIIDTFIYTEEGYKQIFDFPVFQSQMFNVVKPKDAYQAAAMDSLKRNQFTMLRGPAGTGKSWLAISYLFQQLEKGKIDKIIIFCNTVATAGAAKLGYYPGSRDEKLLDSQIGNFLASKLGDRQQVERMIEQGQLILIPLSDSRGYDTSNMRAGIYVTEAQNLNIPMLKLILQRVGSDSMCIIEGDDKAQVDLPIYAGENNGMRRASKVFRGSNIYGEIQLQNIYRSKIAELAEAM